MDRRTRSRRPRPQQWGLVILLILGALAGIVLGILGIIFPRANKVAMTTSVIPPGPTCPAGGMNVVFCQDGNGDGACGHSSDIILSNKNICDGEQGEQGEQGENYDPLTTPSGWVASWWDQPGFGKLPDWAVYDGRLGRALGPSIGYSVTEDRTPGWKLQFGSANRSTALSTVVHASISDSKYFMVHDPATNTNEMAFLQANPANHRDPEIVTYDDQYDRYVAVAPADDAPDEYVLVTIDPDTGAIAEFTGYGGSRAPNFAQALDMLAIGPYVVFWNRNDLVMGFAQFFNRTDGQYIAGQQFVGTLEPYPGTFLRTWLTMGYPFWFIQGVGYDTTTYTLHLVIGAGGGEADGAFGWVEATSDEDMAAQLFSGNYTIHITQHYPEHIINAAEFLQPPAMARRTGGKLPLHRRINRK